MDHKEFLEKYSPDCYIHIVRPFGYGQPIQIVVKVIACETDFKESMLLHDDTNIIKGLDSLCDRIHRSVRLYKNPSLAKRIFPFLYKK